MKTIDVSSINASMLDAVVRLVRLLDTPHECKALAPLVMREIVYRLLSGGQGVRLSHLLASGGDTRRTSRAIGHLREHFDEPLKIENIAPSRGFRSTARCRLRTKTWGWSIVTGGADGGKSLCVESGRRLLLDRIAADQAEPENPAGVESGAGRRSSKKVQVTRLTVADGLASCDSHLESQVSAAFPVHQRRRRVTSYSASIQCKEIEWNESKHPIIRRSC